MAVKIGYKVVPGKDQYTPESWIKFVNDFEKITKGLPEAHVMAVKKSMEKARRVITTKYLTGPRPEKLGVVTGRLRSSIRWEIKRLSKTIIEASIGTDVWYGELHEEGYKELKRGGKSKLTVVKQKRPFLKPGIEETYPYIAKQFEKIGLQLFEV